MKTLTEIVFESDCPYANMYQGADKKVLFVCSAGILRSATAARLYARKYNTRCCGTAPYALIRLSDNLVAWADEIVFVNDENYQAARCMYDFKSINGEKKVVVLDIPDDYAHMHPELIKHFKEQYEDF